MELTIFTLLILLFSIMIHEIAHGAVAYSLGDATAKYSGRLTLNPLKHLDPIGSIFLPLMLLIITAGRGPIFGWAKPVPVNPYNFRDQKWGMLKVSLAGPATNFLIAIFFSLLLRFFSSILIDPLIILFGIIAIYNFTWGIFNIIPIFPLDGFHILFTFLPERFSQFRNFLQQYNLLILILFIYFGLNWVFSAASFLFRLTSGFSL